MSGVAWGFLIVIGVAVVGYIVISSQSGGVQSSSGSQSTLSNIASIFKSTSSLVGDLKKAMPSWFEDDSPITDDDLNSYASSSGFASH